MPSRGRTEDEGLNYPKHACDIASKDGDGNLSTRDDSKRGRNIIARMATAEDAASTVAAIQRLCGLTRNVKRGCLQSAFPLLNNLLISASYLAIEKLSLMSVVFWTLHSYGMCCSTFFLLGMTGGTLVKDIVMSPRPQATDVIKVR